MIKIELPEYDREFAYSELRNFREDLLLYPGGIYVLYGKGGERLYVGKSKNLYERLRSHSSSPFADKIARVSVIFEDDPTSRDIFETYAIKTLAPEHNKDKVYVDNSGDHIRAEISDLQAERAALKTILYDLESARDDLTAKLTPPNRRTFNNNFSPDDCSLSDGFTEYLDELDCFYANYDSDDEFELRGIEDEIISVTDEIEHISDKIQAYLLALRV